MSGASVKPPEMKASITWHSLRVNGLRSPQAVERSIGAHVHDAATKLSHGRKRPGVNILDGLEGTLKGGEMLLVLGKPGSGCTTFLKALAGRLEGLELDNHSEVTYRGASQELVRDTIRGKCVYMAEDDVHFPHLTVRQTLAIASKSGYTNAESTDRIPPSDLAEALRLSQALDVKVGNDLVHGCSGGERKRISIAEVLVSDSPIQCWDNPTRGLDSENASIFIKTLRQQCDNSGLISIVTLYQASEEIFNAFQKVMVLYEGRQIFFGSTTKAKSYFYDLGFDYAPRVSTSDFLASLTNPPERTLRPGFEGTAPTTSKQFEDIWKTSVERGELHQAIGTSKQSLPAALDHRSQAKPAYRRSYYEQVYLCMVRCFQRLAKDLTPPISAIGGNFVLSLILGSMFYNMSDDTNSFYGRGILIFFATLTNTFLGAFEGVLLWEHRPIVEKHKQYGFFRPSAEALASMFADLPNKLLLSAVLNIPFYLLANMRRTAGAFFTFYLFSFSCLLTGSTLFRTLGSISRTIASSIAPGATFVLLLVIYTGFVLPIPDMPPWLGWIRYINPMGYAFESLMINEFGGRQFRCSELIPGTTKCAALNTGADSLMVDGSAYIQQTYDYQLHHIWRNLGLMALITSVLCVTCLVAAEKISAQKSEGEIIKFRREKRNRSQVGSDVEAQPAGVHYKEELRLNTPEKPRDALHQRGTFLWRHVSCDMKESKGTKRILNEIDGWISPGTLTALMGASGAGKTTLLSILADRPSVGVVSGTRLIDTVFQDDSFTRKVGYAQQQDIHLATMTVREALEFSALLRQPAKYSNAERLQCVDETIADLELSAIQHAVIGPVGAGLNVEQRKRLTIGIELVARPELLLFLDEPTSGLDSNTAWSICRLLRKLCDNGQTILCTIHQPSAKLFDMFDRLLLLQEGQTIYFGDVGRDAHHITTYFEKRGAQPCKASENPSEWMMKAIDDPKTSWSEMWRQSEEYTRSQIYMDEMQDRLSASQSTDSAKVEEFASSFWTQLKLVTWRNLQHDWRTPSYISSKILLTAGMGLANGFSFYKSSFDLQGVQNQMFSIFLLFILHSNLIQIILPQFLDQRVLYESRESLSKTYSWKVFILSNLISELPMQTLLAVVQFATWYFPIGTYNNAAFAGDIHSRAGLMFLVTWSFTICSSTFSHLLGTLAPDAATGINISASLWSLSLMFCGILVKPSSLPTFWIFMYRVTPITYFVSAMASVSLTGAEVVCSPSEIITVATKDGATCGAFFADFARVSGARLLNELSTTECQICPVSNTDALLAGFRIYYSERWRNYGISIVFSVVNILGALGLYWLVRVKDSRGGLARGKK